MRLLIVNPNTSRGVTDRIAAAAQAAAQPGDRFVTTQAAFGPDLIVTDADARVAADGVLAAVEAHSGAVDGIVLASFGDTGAAAVRAARPGLPVVGLAGAAFGAAAALGPTTAIVTFSDAVVPGLRAMARRHGIDERLLTVASLGDVEVGDPGAVQDRFAVGLARLCLRAAEAGAASIVLGGGPLAGLALRIAPRVPVPVIDGVAAAVGVLRGVTHSAPASTAAADAL